MEIALLLIALGFGFKIFADADTYAKKQTRKAAQAVGLFIIMISLIGTFFSLRSGFWYGSLGCGTGSFCPMHDKNSALIPFYPKNKMSGLCPFKDKDSYSPMPPAKEPAQRKS